MSNLLSTSAMVTECQSRVPIGLSSTFWMKKLNEAFRWISQKGNFIWDLKGTDITLAGGINWFDLPTDCDPGKPMYLVGPIADFGSVGTLDTLVPYVAWDDAGLQKFSELGSVGGTTGVVEGVVSCWTFRATFTNTVGPPPVYTYKYTGYFFPADAVSLSAEFRIVYHTDVSGVEYTSGTNIFFPTPNSFDNLMIELAEAEARRIYGLAGFEMIQKRAESAIVTLLDSYRSTKNALPGLVDQQKQVSERQLMKQERG
jgi:hypothetical protein